jgi:hypothetical protein
MSKAINGKQVLQAMEWIITNVGWCQGNFFQDIKGGTLTFSEAIKDYHQVGAVCLSGACEMVEVGTDKQASREAFDLFFTANNQYFIAYNDAPGRTKEEVIAALRKAIQEAQ